MKKYLRILFLSFMLSILITSMLPSAISGSVIAMAAANESSYSLEIGETAQLSLSDITSGIKWKSSNSSVVSVSSKGKITAKKKGTTSIIATYKGSSYKWIITVKNSLLNACKTGNTDGLSKTDVKLAKKVGSIISKQIKSNMTDYEKVKSIHDYIILNTAYDTRESLPNASYHPEGCLLNKTSVCQGYAETFSLFMNVLNIKNNFITGSATSSDGQTISHAWNSVLLDGKWYMLDLTWDDPVPDAKGYVRYDYFLRTDSFFKKDHTWKADSFPACKATAYLMKPYESFIVTDETEAETSYLSQIDDKASYITFAYPKNTKINFDFLYQYQLKIRYYPKVTRGDYTIYIIIID